MSIDLFKTILEQKASIVASTHTTHKSVIKILYNYHKLKKFIDDNIMKNKDPVTYQFLFNFANFMQVIPNGTDIDHMMIKDSVIFYDQLNEFRNITFFKISFIDESYTEDPDVLYEYSIHPITSPGEIKFEYTRMYKTKDVHESKTFINSLELDPHKDNLYTKSAEYFLSANDKIHRVIKIFFKYYIDETKRFIIVYSKSKLLRFIWRGIDE